MERQDGTRGDAGGVSRGPSLLKSTYQQDLASLAARASAACLVRLSGGCPTREAN